MPESFIHLCQDLKHDWGVWALVWSRSDKDRPGHTSLATLDVTSKSFDGVNSLQEVHQIMLSCSTRAKTIIARRSVAVLPV